MPITGVVVEQERHCRCDCRGASGQWSVRKLWGQDDAVDPCRSRRATRHFRHNSCRNRGLKQRQIVVTKGNLTDGDDHQSIGLFQRPCCSPALARIRSYRRSERGEARSDVRQAPTKPARHSKRDAGRSLFPSRRDRNQGGPSDRRDVTLTERHSCHRGGEEPPSPSEPVGGATATAAPVKGDRAQRNPGAAIAVVAAAPAGHPSGQCQDAAPSPSSRTPPWHRRESPAWASPQRQRYQGRQGPRAADAKPITFSATPSLYDTTVPVARLSAMASTTCLERTASAVWPKLAGQDAGLGGLHQRPRHQAHPAQVHRRRRVGAHVHRRSAPGRQAAPPQHRADLRLR